jgi:hypothetical protein
MDSTSPSLRQLADRLDQLERHNRWLWRALICVLALGGVGLLGAAQGVPGQTGKAEPLVVRDGAGKVRVRLEAAQGGPVLQFLDDQGKPLASMAASPDALVLRLFNERGKLKSGLSVESDGIAMVSFDGSGRLQSGRAAILETSGIFGRR